MGAIVFGLFAIAFGTLTLKHVSYAVVALICMFAFEQWGALYLSFVAANTGLVNIAILSLALFSMFRLPPTVVLEFVVYPIRGLLFLLLVYAYLSTAWAPFDAQAPSKFIGNLHYIVIYAFIAPIIVVKREDFTQLLNVIVVVGGILVVLFAYVPTFEGRSITAEYDFDASVTLPLTLGDFAGAILLIAIIRIKPNLLHLSWSMFVAASALVLIAKTGSRGQLAFAMLALLICFPVRWKQLTVNRFLTLLIIIALGVVALMFVLFTENTLSGRLVSATGEVQTGADARIFMIQVLLNEWSSSDLATLIFGLGSSASWSPTIVGFYPHVVPLEILGEMGLLGFTVFSIIVVSLFLMAFSSRLKSQLSDQSVVDFAALFGCFVFALLISTKQGSFIESIQLMLYIALVEKCFRVGLLQNRKKSKKRRRRRRSNYSPLASSASGRDSA